MAMNTTQASAFGSLLNIFFEPKKTLEAVRGRVAWLWLPLVIVLILNCIVQAWYAQKVDISWFADQTLAPDAANLTADQLRAAHARFSSGSMMFFGIAGGLIGLPVWYLIQSLYFFMIAKLNGYQEQGFGNWFSFICWTSLPGILAIVATGVYMATTSSSQISPIDIDVTSLNTLLFHVPYAHNGQFIASSLRITTLWSWAIMVIGFAAWTGKDLKRSTLLVLAPYAVLYAIFIIKALL